MIIPEWDDARVSVIRRLQSIAEEHAPGTETFEIADHAIDLALSADRSTTDEGHLLRNVWRNSRFIYRRRQRTDPITDPLDVDSPVGSRIASGELVGFADIPTPEDVAVANDLEERIRREASRADRFAPGSLDGLLDGESLEETARRLRTTPRRIRRARARVRMIARSLTDAATAA